MKLINKKMNSDISLDIINAATNNADNNLKNCVENTFHNTLNFVLLMGQFFGVMPLYGICSKNLHEVKFKWKSFRFLYALYNAGGAIVTFVFCLVKFAFHGLEISDTAPAMFYIANFCAAIQFIKIAKNWPKILREWSYVEVSMKNNYGLVQKLRRRFVILTITVMGLALIEHLLFILNALYESRKGDEFTAEIYFQTIFPHYFALIRFTSWAAILIEISNVISTFTWNFTDLFIILISISLTVRFKQIVSRMKTTKVMHEKFWREIREDYNKMSHLTNVVDDHISTLILISYINNIYFLCIQLYNSIKERVGLIETLYFFFSFGFLVARTIVVSMYGAWLHDETRRPLEIIYSVPSENYCMEIKRLNEQIVSSPIGITGSRFFIVTRSFLLQMAGTIITFELMVFQFAPVDKKR